MPVYYPGQMYNRRQVQREKKGMQLSQQVSGRQAVGLLGLFFWILVWYVTLRGTASGAVHETSAVSTLCVMAGIIWFLTSLSQKVSLVTKKCEGWPLFLLSTVVLTSLGTYLLLGLLFLTPPVRPSVYAPPINRICRPVLISPYGLPKASHSLARMSGFPLFRLQRTWTFTSK